MWTTTDGSIECVGGWCDTAHLHTEPGGASGWASLLVDADGNEITTATPGYVVTRGQELAALDAGAGMVHENVSDASFEWDAESVGGDAPVATERSLDSLDEDAAEMRAEPEPQAGLVDPEVSAQKLASPHAARLAARTFSPWRPPLATSPPEPEPEPEPAPSQSRKAVHGRRERPSCIYMSVTGKDRFDGSRERPVQTLQRVRELMAAEQVTKAVQLTPAGTNPDGSVHHVATDMIDERPRSGAASEQGFAPSFLSQVSPYPPKSSLPHLHGKWNNMTSSLDDQLSLLNSTIRSAELDLSETEGGTEGEEAAPLMQWSPPRPVAVQLADTRAVLSSPAAATLFFDSSSVPSPPSARPARLVPTPPRQPPKSSPSRSSRSRLSSRLSDAENVATSVEASTIATTIAQVAVGAGFADLNATVEKTQAEVDADLEKCRTMIARNSRRRHKRAAKAVAVPKPVQPGSETAQGVQRKPAPRGAAAGTTATGQKELGLQRHALEVAMADELPQRVTGEGIIPPSAYAVLYWNGERIGQTQVVMSSRQPRWRQTFELAHVKLENEGHNGLEVEVWSLPAGAKTAPKGSVMTPPPTPPISSAASSTSSLEGSSSIGRSASAKLGGSKKLLGKAMWKGKAGEFPEGMLVLALPTPKSSYASSSRLPAISDSNPSVPHDEGPSVVVTSGPRIMIKLIQRSAVHTIREGVLDAHKMKIKQFDNEMEAIMSHIAAADEQLEEKRKEEEAQRAWDARLESHLQEILVGAAKNAAAELRHQAAKAQRRSKLAAARRAAAEIIAECMRVVDIELGLGITTDRQAEAASAATKLQATHRGKRDRAAVAEMKTKKIEEDLSLTGSAEETAAVAKMQAQARGKKARQELSEKKQAATRIAAVHRGNQSRARVSGLRVEASLGLTGTEAESARIARLQAQARGKQARQELQGQAVAATQIAAAQRGRQGRARVAGLRIESKLGLSEQDTAGIARIQATQRGKAARQELAEQATAAASIQAVQRGKSTRRRRQAVREDGAAAKLQATARGRAARRELEDQKAAATKIAAVQRGKSTRRERQAVREEGAAAKLQATARGRAARKELAEQSDAATKIAAAHRGRQDRARLAQMDLDKPLSQPSQPLVPQMARTPTPSRD